MSKKILDDDGLQIISIALMLANIIVCCISNNLLFLIPFCALLISNVAHIIADKYTEMLNFSMNECGSCGQKVEILERYTKKAKLFNRIVWGSCLFGVVSFALMLII